VLTQRFGKSNGSDHDKADNDAWSDAHDGQQPTAITQRPMFPDGRLSRKGGYGKVIAMHGAQVPATEVLAHCVVSMQVNGQELLGGIAAMRKSVASSRISHNLSPIKD
jgi:hypothetical protein